MNAPLASTPLVNAVVFAGYENAKKIIASLSAQPAQVKNSKSGGGDEDSHMPVKLSLSQLGLCGGMAGVMACTIVAPIEMIRIRMQVQSSIKPLYKGKPPHTTPHHTTHFS